MLVVIITYVHGHNNYVARLLYSNDETDLKDA